MKDEKIIELLKQFGYWGEENTFFYTLAPQSFSTAPNMYGKAAITLYKYYIVNMNENGIAVIPFTETGKCVEPAITFIPKENVKKIYTEPYKFMLMFHGTRYTIELIDGKIIELEYNKKPAADKIMQAFQ